MDEDHRLWCVAIICIAILEAAAIVTGLDGQYFGIAIAAISAIAGYGLKTLRDKIKKK